MSKGYKISKEMGRNKSKEGMTKEDQDFIDSVVDSLTKEELENVIESADETIEFESSFYWRDNYEGSSSEAILIANNLFTFIKSAEKHIGKPVVGILPMDDNSTKLLLGDKD